jgi:hypothetical protein
MSFKSQLELFIERYVLNIKRFENIREKKSLILKALYMIDAQLGVPCCDDPLAIVSYIRKDDILTNYLRNYFSESFDRRKNKISLLKCKKLLQSSLGAYVVEYPYPEVDLNDSILGNCCTVQLRTGVFEEPTVDDNNVSITLTDLTSGETIVIDRLFNNYLETRVIKRPHRLRVTREALRTDGIEPSQVIVDGVKNNTLIIVPEVVGDFVEVVLDFVDKESLIGLYIIINPT